MVNSYKISSLPVRRLNVQARFKVLKMSRPEFSLAVSFYKNQDKANIYPSTTGQMHLTSY